MTSFVKCGVVLCVGLIVMAAWPGHADDTKSKSGSKKAKDAKAEATPARRHVTDVPVIKDHPSYKMFIPYLTPDGKRQMNFKIAVATRIDDNHVNLKDMQIETFEEEGGDHEMDINLPDSVLDTDTSVITTHHHVKIQRYDFELTGDSMIFNTRTKQGGLAGNVHMLIYDLQSKAPKPTTAADSSSPPAPEKK